jgi:TetR/AcrR family transcriptional regulator, regulator of cefoperazone and chloramphenicol sensitivity
MGHTPDKLETNDRLLKAAAEVFAEVGYRAATLREICRRGEANLAAVNYHFRDKEQLYVAVVDREVAAADPGLALLAPQQTDPPEEQLRHFIHQFLHNLLGTERPALLLRMMSHEALEPSAALDVVVEKAARPVKKILSRIIAELLGPAVNPEAVRDCAASVLAQCVMYHHSEAIARRLDGVEVHDPATIEHLAEHVFRFSLAGIRGLAGHGAAADDRSDIYRTHVKEC